MGKWNNVQTAVTQKRFLLRTLHMEAEQNTCVHSRWKCVVTEKRFPSKPFGSGA